MVEKDNKRMKSFRLNASTADYLRDTAADLGISQADVIELALCAFSCYGVDVALSNARYDHETPKADLRALVYMSSHGNSIECAVSEHIDAAAQH